MTEGAPVEPSPKDRLEIARQEFSRTLLDSNPASTPKLISRLAMLQSTLYSNAKDIHPEAIFAELTRLSQLALDRAETSGDKDTVTTLHELHSEYEASHKAFEVQSSATILQPTRTENLPPMTRPKTDVIRVREKSQKTQTEEKPLSPKLQQMYDLLNKTDNPISPDELAEKLGINVRSVQPYISGLRTSGRQVEVVREDGKIIGYRIARPLGQSETEASNS